jgi:L-iditol 2-dehydrogenase
MGKNTRYVLGYISEMFLPSKGGVSLPEIYMKAALLLNPEKIEIGETALPHPAPGEVLIRPGCIGICGTDVSFYLGHRPVPYPFVLGHEVLGHVAALGKGVANFYIGQRIIVEPNYPCGTCALCLSGRGSVCARKSSMGVSVPGCLSEFALAPAEFVWGVPDSISDQNAATIEPLTVSLHGFLLSGAKSGDTVVVLGCGVVGLLLIHAAIAAGVRVLACDRSSAKQEMARTLGAVIFPINDAPRTWEAENVGTVFECAGAAATVELALQAAPRGAQVVLLGLSSSPASFIPMRLVREGINIRTSMIYDHPFDFSHAIDLVSKGTLHPAQVVTHSFAFSEIDMALHLASTGEAGKIHILMQ